MKKYLFFIMAMILSNLLVQAQIIKPQKVKKTARKDKPQVISPKPKIKLSDKVIIISEGPDLQITDFSINTLARQTFSDSFKYPYTVTIENTGNKAATGSNYDLTFEVFDEVNGWGGHNAPGVNCQKLTQAINPGQTISHSGMLTLMKYQVSNQDLKIRAYIDAACSSEFPNAWGHIKESNENNNFSNEIILLGSFNPTVGNITPNECIKGADEVIMMGGMGFGTYQGNHAVILRNANHKVAAEVTDWKKGVIYFKVPNEVKTGMNKVYIGDATSLVKTPTCNEQNLNVLGEKVLAWNDLIGLWDIFKDAFTLKLNTYGGGSTYENTSFIRLVETTPIEVPKIQFNAAGLKYRSLIKDMNTQEGGIVLTKEGCNHNQLRMQVTFESSGIEIRTFNRALIKGAQWCDGCVADIHINDGLMDILFTFTSSGNSIDFDLDTNFKADVKASNAFSDAMMNLFLGNWNNDVRNEVNKGVKYGLMNYENKNYIINELKNLINLQLGMGDKHVLKYEFKNTGIHVTYY